MRAQHVDSRGVLLFHDRCAVRGRPDRERVDLLPGGNGLLSFVMDYLVTTAGGVKHSGVEFSAVF